MDSDTLDLLKTLGMSNLPGVKQQQAQTGGYQGFGGPAGGYGAFWSAGALAQYPCPPQCVMPTETAWFAGFVFQY